MNLAVISGTTTSFDLWVAVVNQAGIKKYTMPTVLITGGTGMIGTALSRHLLQQGYDVIILSRNPIPTASNYRASAQQNSFRPSGNIFYAKWDTEKMMIDAQAIAKTDYIVHLAGEGVAKKRWTKKRKEEIRQSRTKSSELLFHCLSTQPNKVKAVISASAIGWYGPDAGKIFTEDDPAAARTAPARPLRAAPDRAARPAPARRRRACRRAAAACSSH